MPRRRSRSNSDVARRKYNLPKRSKTATSLYRANSKDAFSSHEFSRERFACPSFMEASATSKKSTATASRSAPVMGSTESNVASSSTSGYKSRSAAQLKRESVKSKILIHKKSVSEQFTEVLKYLQECNPAYRNPHQLRPPTINTFVNVMNILLSKIDSNIQLDTTNYRDTVRNTLKALKYPGNISNSLLKTVYTMHAWPKVIHIFAWLIDLITTVITHVESFNPDLERDPAYQKAQCATKYVTASYMLDRNGGDQRSADKEFKNVFVKILNSVEELEFNTEEAEATRLRVERDKTAIKKLSKENELLRHDVDTRQHRISIFYYNKLDRQGKFKDELASVTTRRDNLEEIITSKKYRMNDLEKLVKTQPCTHDEKRKMMMDIDVINNTIKLITGHIAMLIVMKQTCNSKEEIKTNEVRIEINRLNETAKKLINLEPELNLLILSDDDISSVEFENEIQNLNTNIRMFEIKFRNEIKRSDSTVATLEEDIKYLEQRGQFYRKTISSINETQDSLKANIKTWNDAKENMTKRREERKITFEQKAQEMSESQINIGDIRKNLESQREIKRQKEDEFESRKTATLEFFVTLRSMMRNKLNTMKDIQSEMFILLEEKLKAIQQLQTTVQEDLKALDEILDSK